MRTLTPCGHFFQTSFKFARQVQLCHLCYRTEAVENRSWTHGILVCGQGGVRIKHYRWARPCRVGWTLRPMDGNSTNKSGTDRLDIPKIITERLCTESRYTRYLKVGNLNATNLMLCLTVPITSTHCL